MTAAITSFAAIGHGAPSYWYFTRAAGLMALVVLSATVVLGIVSSVGWVGERWPRFFSQGLHRNLSLYCLALVAAHVLSTVADGYVPITIADAFVPFSSPYRPIWVGFGAVAFDVLLAIAVTAGLRRRIGQRAWRGVHWLAYLCWPVAVVHGLGSGSDTRLKAGAAVYVVCALAVAAAGAWRLWVARDRFPGRTVIAGLGGAMALVVIAAFAMVGPLRPGWSEKGGTSVAAVSGVTAPVTHDLGATAHGGAHHEPARAPGDSGDGDGDSGDGGD